jgi:WD40 repeat protein
MFCWDIATGNLLWQNKEFSPVSMVVTPDGKILSSMEKFPALNLATGQAIQLEKKPPISPLGDTRLTLMPDGRTLLLSTGQGVVVWDLSGSQEPRTVAGAGEEVVGFPNGKTVLTNNGSLQRWDLTTGEPLWPNNFKDGHVGEVIAVAYSGDGKRLVSGSTDGTVRLWAVTTGKPLHVWRGHAAQRPPIGLVALAKAGVMTLDISRDGCWILSGGAEEHVELWDASTGQHVRSLAFPQRDNGEFYRPLFHLRISPDGNRAVGLFGGQAIPGANGLNPPPKAQHHLASWDLKTGKLIQCVPTEETEAASSAISPDGRTLVSKGSLIDVATGREMLRLDGAETSSSGVPFAFSPDGALVVGGSTRKFPNDRRFGNGIFVWETITGKKIAQVESRYWVAQVTSHPSGRLVASNDLNGIQVWDVSTSKLVATPPLPEKVTSRTTMGSYVSCMAFSPDGHSLAAGLPDGTILLWDITVPFTRSEPPGPMELDRLWAELMEGDAAKAWKAIWRLVDSADAAVHLLQERLIPSPSAPNDVTGPLLADLDSVSFQRRQDAEKRLKELKYQAEPALRKALEANPSLEQKRRIEEILKELRQHRPRVSPEELRELRAVTVLSRIGLPPARRILEELTKGPKSAPLTRHAKAALPSAK